MSLFHEVRRQPRTTRQIMFVLSVVTTLSLVGMIWLNSFQKDMYALLNPASENPEDQRRLADTEGIKSPFTFLKESFQSVAASIGSLFGKQENGTNFSPPPPVSSDPARWFPVSN